MAKRFKNAVKDGVMTHKLDEIVQPKATCVCVHMYVCSICVCTTYICTPTYIIHLS